jgi:hypothetical protein
LKGMKHHRTISLNKEESRDELKKEEWDSNEI